MPLGLRMKRGKNPLWPLSSLFFFFSFFTSSSLVQDSWSFCPSYEMSEDACNVMTARCARTGCCYGDRITTTRLMRLFQLSEVTSSLAVKVVPVFIKMTLILSLTEFSLIFDACSQLISNWPSCNVPLNKGESYLTTGTRWHVIRCTDILLL